MSSKRHLPSEMWKGEKKKIRESEKEVMSIQEKIVRLIGKRFGKATPLGGR